jgi:Carboxypeptidase regulatory-like domain
MLERGAARTLLLALAAMFVSIAHGQIPTGSLNGLVTDHKDAIVVGARVTAVSTTQGFSRDTLTSSSGLYVLTDLPVGQYNLKIVCRHHGRWILRLRWTQGLSVCRTH